MKELFFVLWFFAPAGLANVSAFLSSKIKILKKFNQPVDARLTFRKKRILGSHKTIRGFIVGIILAIIGVCVEILLYNNIPFLQKIIPIDYSTVNPIQFGFLSGFGALAGDGLKSFFKRQMNITPGKSWVPFDQIDYILGGMFFTYFYLPLSLTQYLLLFFSWAMIHPIFTLWGYLIKLRKAPL